MCRKSRDPFSNRHMQHYRQSKNELEKKRWASLWRLPCALTRTGGQRLRRPGSCNHEPIMLFVHDMQCARTALIYLQFDCNPYTQAR